MGIEPANQLGHRIPVGVLHKLIDVHIYFEFGLNLVDILDRHTCKVANGRVRVLGIQRCGLASARVFAHLPSSRERRLLACSTVRHTFRRPAVVFAQMRDFLAFRCRMFWLRWCPATHRVGVPCEIPLTTKRTLTRCAHEGFLFAAARMSAQVRGLRKRSFARGTYIHDGLYHVDND